MATLSAVHKMELYFFQPSHIDDITLWKGVWELITEPKARKKLDSVNTLEDVVNLIQNSRKIIVLTGAGVSCIFEQCFTLSSKYF